ncbi:MAG: hypothetical protein F4Z40_03295 [Chloroflexi bacterium]|nr:hypothetical protein [Chloroflexota bacterium]
MAANSAGRPRIAIAAGTDPDAALARVAADRPATLVLGSWGSPLADPAGIKRLAALTNSAGIDLLVESADAKVLELARREGLATRPRVPVRWRLLAPLGRSYALLTGSGPYWDRSRAELLLGGPMLAVAILLALAAAWLLLLFPSARVEIEVEQLDRRLDLTAFANPSFSDVNARQRLLPGRIITTRVSGSTTRFGSGRRPVGVEPARGAVQVLNLTEQILQIPAGTVLASDDGRRYILTSEFALPTQAQLQALGDGAEPAPDSEPPDGETGPGEEPVAETALERALAGIVVVETYRESPDDLGQLAAIADVGAMRVAIEAERAGAGSNLAAGTSLRAIGPYGALLQLTLQEPLSGGVDRQEDFVTEAEREAALQELQARLRAQAEAELSAQLVTGDYGQVLPESELRPAYTTRYLTIRDPAGGVSFEYQVELELQATVFRRSDLEELAQLELTGARLDPVPYRMLPGTLQLNEPRLSVTLGNTVAVQYEAAARIERLIDPRTVREQIAGLSFDEAFAYVNSIDGVARTDLRIWSPFGDAVTWLTPRIEVDIAADG